MSFARPGLATDGHASQPGHQPAATIPRRYIARRFGRSHRHVSHTPRDRHFARYRITLSLTAGLMAAFATVVGVNAQTASRAAQPAGTGTAASVTPMEGAAVPGESELEMMYFGAAGWRISDGNVVVLIDPWPSRLKYGGGGHPDDTRRDFARTDLAYSDTTLIDSLITEADFILVHHGHFDHLGDVPYIARKTGAKVIGTETTMMILRAYGIPSEQLYAVGGGEDYQFENFSVRVVPGLHSALNDKHYHDSRRYDGDTDLEAPLRIEQFIEGGSLSFLARFEGRTVLTMGSMNFVEREFEGLEPDILLAGINGSRLGLYDYDRRLLESTGFPEIVIPTHWDNFRLPYGFSQQANIERNLVPFVETVRTLSPSTRVIIPVHVEPFTVR